jgi:hypothetical protein
MRFPRHVAHMGMWSVDPLLGKYFETTRQLLLQGKDW